MPASSHRGNTLKVIFVDRDGVINQDRPDYVKSWTEFQFIPGSLEALKRLTVEGYRIIVITNQSVINRHMVSQQELQEIHSNMVRAAAAHGGDIEAVFYCPHVPDDRCSCRKPAQGLIRQAQEKYQIDLSETSMIGDSLKDMQCARKAGCENVILVRTGHGVKTEGLCREKGITPDFVADDLKSAVEWLLNSGSRLKAES
jgi:D-glycero-D-manno-heptose 1,7-bisphosphate phosphatase